MEENTVFNHSIKVPQIYKVASKLFKQVIEGEETLKNLIYKVKRGNIKAIYALVIESLKRDKIVTDLIEKSKLLINEPRLNIHLAKILICELLWGKNKMRGDSKPIQTILSYENEFKNLLKNYNEDDLVSNIKKEILKPRYVRINTLKTPTNVAINNFIEEGWKFVQFPDKSDYDGFIKKVNSLGNDEFMEDIHVSDLLIFPPKTEFYKSEPYINRNIILQDKASCLPVTLLNPTPNSKVLDMCAAPGMKTTQLASMIKNKGIVYAVEQNPKRARVLQDFVNSTGATCVKTIFRDVMEVTNEHCKDVEYILVDPSCSGSGISDRIETTQENLTNKMERLRKLSNFQGKLLRYAFKTFPNAKRIVYSTCSINSEENDDVVRQVLETSKDFKLINAKKLLNSWNNKTSDNFPQIGDMCIYANFNDDKTNGFFIAVFERLEKGEKNPFLNVELCKLYDRKNKENFGDSLNFSQDIKGNKRKMANGGENEKNSNFQMSKMKKSNEIPVKIEENTEIDSFKKEKRKKVKKEEDCEESRNLESIDVGSMKKNKENFDDSLNVAQEKKKNKRKKENEGIAGITVKNEDEEVKVEDNFDFQKGKMKKKKKSKDNSVETLVAIEESVENYLSKKEKRKKVKSEEDSNEINEESKSIESTDIGSKSMKKEENLDDSLNVSKDKKKRKLENDEGATVTLKNEVEEEISDSQKNKIKKKKKSKENSIETPVKIEECMENDTPKKKKSKKDKKDKLNEIESINEESIIKDKKKKNKDENEGSSKKKKKLKS